MSRLAAVLTLSLAAFYAPDTIAQAPASPPTVRQSTVCQVAANGGPILADRGIGGTGIGMGQLRLAERGIGGTGIGAEIPQSVVRGLTGIGTSTRHTAATRLGDAGVVGVITGFNSVCIDGTEIGLDGAVPMQIDGTTVPGTALRAGQVAVIEAATENGVMRSLNLAIRHEVVGPVERLDLVSGAMTVAGQTVAVSAGTWGAGQFSLGDWVSVSGLRRPDGGVLATRVDVAPRGLVAIRGRVVAVGGRLRIGSTTLLPASDTAVRAGMFVAVSGHYSAGTLRVEKLENDLLAQDPTAFFGNSMHRIIERAVMRVEAGQILLNGVLPVALAPGVTLLPADELDAVVTLDRSADGVFLVTRVDTAKPVTTR